MSYTNLELAELLRAVAASYQLQDEKTNRFKIVAYQRAADAVEHATSELKDLWDDGKLETVPSIGPSISKHLDELFRIGKSKHFERVMKGIPKEAFKLMELPGIGIKTALRLIAQGKPSEVQDLLQKVEKIHAKGKRYLLPYASLVASEVIEYLRLNKKVTKADPLGSLRRQVATVGDIDIAVATDSPQEVIEYFTRYPKAQKVIEKGEHTASILLPGDVQVDLMVQETASYGSLLQHFTGSKHHNIALREYARSLRPSLSLSEYGIKELKASNLLRSKSEKLKAFNTEEGFYKALGLDWIPPELREDAGEIEAALRPVRQAQGKQAQGKPEGLPKLLSYEDIKGDLQIHSSFDIETSHDLGASSMQQVVSRAKELGYEYIAFTEHNPSKSKHSEKEIVDLLKRKREAIEELNYSRTIKLFNSLEIDILSEGGLPVGEAGMQTLDFALVSIHSSFQFPREAMTKRVLSALAHPKVKIFAHPTGRILNRREGVELDWEEIFDFCLKNNKWLEINADPMRLDLPDTQVREAVKAGVKLSLGTDAHHVDALNNMRYGVSVARRGWAEAKDIVNTYPLKELEKMLK